MENFLNSPLALPLLQRCLSLAGIAFPLAALFAFAGMGGMSAVARGLALARRRSSYDKGGRQIAFFALSLGWLLLIGGRLWLFLARPEYIAAPPAWSGILAEGGWIFLCGAVITVSLYFALWNALAKMPFLHMALGITGSILGLLAVACALVSIRYFSCQPLPAGSELRAIFPPGFGSPFWDAVILAAPLAVAMPAAWSAPFLPLLRNHDNFGRDHYNGMMAWCARWARNVWVLFWLLLLLFTARQIWARWRDGSFGPTDAASETLCLLLWLAPAVLWFLAGRSLVPLRHKFSLLLAALISMLFFFPYCQMVMAR